MIAPAAVESSVDRSMDWYGNAGEPENPEWEGDVQPPKGKKVCIDVGPSSEYERFVDSHCCRNRNPPTEDYPATNTSGAPSPSPRNVRSNSDRRGLTASNTLTDIALTRSKKNKEISAAEKEQKASLRQLGKRLALRQLNI
jgi:hypothetical protein